MKYRIISRRYGIKWYCFVASMIITPGCEFCTPFAWYEYDLTAEEIGQLLGGN